MLSGCCFECRPETLLLINNQSTNGYFGELAIFNVKASVDKGMLFIVGKVRGTMKTGKISLEHLVVVWSLKRKRKWDTLHRNKSS